VVPLAVHVHEDRGAVLAIDLPRAGDAREALFELGDERRGIDRVLAAVGDRSERRVGRVAPALSHGHVVPVVHGARLAIAAQAHRAHEIEAQAREIDDVVARQALVVEVRVDQPQAAEATFGGTRAADVGEHELGRVADDDPLHLTVAVDEHAHLPTGRRGHLGHRACELGREESIERDPSAVEALERVDVGGRETGCIAVDRQRAPSLGQSIRAEK